MFTFAGKISHLYPMNIFPWGHTRRFNDYASHLKRQMGGRVQKLSVDAGFSCPNRDGLVGAGGCIYCNNDAFNPDYCSPRLTITEQLESGKKFFAVKYPEMRFLAYFQAYSNTYAPLPTLRTRYEEALSVPGIVGIVIGTRPDCVDESVLDYLAELSERVYVMVEYGAESHLTNTLIRINRGHTFEQTISALAATARRNIHSGVHTILGLPGETYADLMDQARTISQLPVENLKLHQLQIHKNTQLAAEYEANPALFQLYTADEYAELVVDYLELLNPAIIVERFVSQAPPDLLIAPKWGMKNYEFVAKVDRLLEERETWQGRYFKN